MSFPSTFAERLSDQPENALPLDAAREDLLWRLYLGRQAGRFTLRDVFDACLQQDSQYQAALTILESLCIANHTAGFDYSAMERIAIGMVEGFLDSHPELIVQRAEEIDAEEDE